MRNGLEEKCLCVERNNIRTHYTDDGKKHGTCLHVCTCPQLEYSCEMYSHVLHSHMYHTCSFRVNRSARFLAPSVRR